MKVIISVVNYRTTGLMLNLLDSVEKATAHARNTISESVVVKLYIFDNSGDWSLQKALAERNSAVNTNLNVSFENLGFGAGHNNNLLRAVSEKADYVWILNSDCYVQHDALSYLLKMAAKFEFPVVLGSTIINSRTGNIETAGGCKYYPLLAYAKNVHKGKELAKLAELREPEYDYLYGASLFFNRALLLLIEEEEQLFDESYFLYFEEIDFFLRFKSRLTKKWCRNSVVQHVGGASSKVNTDGKRSYLALISSIQSSIIFTKKHYPKLFFLTFMISMLLRIIQLLIDGKLRLVRITLLAFLCPKKANKILRNFKK